jgi:lipid A 3-O-deacylase
MRDLRKTIHLLCCLVLGFPGWAAAQGAGELPRPRIVSSNFYEENDVFADTDRHYTQGLKLSLLYEQEGTPPWLEDLVPRLWSVFGDEDLPPAHNAGWTLGQNIYTGEDIRRATPDPDDRPWAGWLYLGRLLQISSDCDPLADVEGGAVCREQQHTFELDLGVVGPASGADWAQSALHEIIDSAEPQGWRHQLGNEPGLLLLYKGKWRFPNRSQTFDFIPHGGMALGNVLTSLSAGGTVRLGFHLSGFGGDVLPAVRRLEGRPTWEAYVFGGAEGRLLGVNIFLDGNHFRDSASVDKEPFVHDLSYGAAVRYKQLRLTYTLVRRSPEFEPRSGRDLGTQDFGSVIVSWER